MSKPLFVSLTLTALCLALSLPLSACGAKTDTPVAGVSPRTLELAKSLLRGELAAVATYEDVIKRNDKPAWGARLASLLEDHKTSAAQLRLRVTALGGDPAMGAGMWGGWTELVAKSAALLGDEPGRAVLESGEKQGVDDYERVLNDPAGDAVTKDLIRSDLLQRTRGHIKTLQEMKA